jgi:glycerol-3-phosphate dehydrogenase (NAD(P)+)
MKSMNAVAEGILTSKSAYLLAQKKGIDCPIIAGIYRVMSVPCSPRADIFACGGFPIGSSSLLSVGKACVRGKSLTLRCPELQVIYEGANPLEVVTKNMSRPLKPEVSTLVANAAHHA